MLRLFVVCVCLALSTAGEANKYKKSKGRITLKTKHEKISYAIGVRTGQNLVRQKMDLDRRKFIVGIKHAFADKVQLSEEELNKVLQAFHKKQSEENKKRVAGIAEKNRKSGSKFLEANKKKDGVVTLASGLQYKVLVQGKGRIPKVTDTVETHYKGTTIDGKEFDSSYKRGKPAVFPVNGVIKGWTEALLMMPVGSKWQLFIPADLAYGERGAGEAIEPNSALLFEIELLGIK